jgi:hypothetical protein
MKFRLKTIAVSTAALLITGGAAYAYISATSVSGSGTAGTASATTALVVRPVSGSTANPLATSTLSAPVSIVVDNGSTVPLRLPAATHPTLTVTPLSGSCPAGSFTVAWTVPTTSFAPGLAQSTNDATVTFVNSTADDQSGCNGATLALSFSV